MQAHCPRCKFDQATIRYDFGDASIVRCSACGLLHLHPWPSEAEVAAVYGGDYFQNERFLTGTHESLYGYADYVAERFNKQPQYADIAREIHQHLASPGASRHERARPRLLEVGCGLGYFLDQAFEEGFDVSGVEFNPGAVERLRRKFAFPIHEGALESMEVPPGSYDAVAMFDVIEHLRAPFEALDQIHDMLSPGGLLIVSTPDAESATSRLIGSRLEDFRRTREHLVFFGRRTLSETLDEHGFELVALKSIGHTFELRFLLERLALYQKHVFHGLRRVVDAIGLGGMQVHVNPHTKMIAIARRRGVRTSVQTLRNNAPEPLAAVDRDVLDELGVLETTSDRHYRWVFDLVAERLGRRVLEVGSGIGVFSKFLISRCDQLTLTDYQPFYLDILRDRFGELPHVERALLDLTQPPFDDARRHVGEGVDSVLCLNVLEHIEDDVAALRGLRELLAPGGNIVLQVPNHPWLFGSLDTTYGHQRRYSPATLRAVVREAGLEVDWLRRFNPYAIPGWFLQGRMLKRPRLDPGALRLYNRAVPALRTINPVVRGMGLSLFASARRTD